MKNFIVEYFIKEARTYFQILINTAKGCHHCTLQQNKNNGF